MNPQEVNAYYSPSYNEIVFPAGILQEPFFYLNDIPATFGGIGAIIGHEMTHGFDDEGCKYDAYGNLNNWWTPDDLAKYKLKTDILRKQFNSYIIEGESVNGSLTLGENIADLGGLTIALEGLKKYLIEHSTENINTSQGTPLHRFFTSYATVWRNNSRREHIKQMLLTDPHSPPLFRVNGIVRNMKDFYDLFNVLPTNI